MFDSTLAFTRYRLEVVRGWPDGEVKDKLITAIESFLRRNEGKPDQPQRAAYSGTPGTESPLRVRRSSRLSLKPGLLVGKTARGNSGCSSQVKLKSIADEIAVSGITALADSVR
jgi:hypothetical protein